LSYDRGNYRDKWRIENEAATVRAGLGLDQLAVLDPSLLVAQLGAQVFHLSDLIPDDEVTLKRARRIGFDGCSSCHPETGELMILINCGRPKRRRMATLMEELAHLRLQHAPSRIERDEFGMLRRNFDRAQEHEAYDLGAALLLPKERIQRDVKEGQMLVGEIADAHGCSHELVTYRIRRMRLAKRYAAYARAAS
jgi:Zn-dependent peptidase ImmA (M78 family)